jgi:hypothetical protein
MAFVPGVSTVQGAIHHHLRPHVDDSVTDVQRVGVGTGRVLVEDGDLIVAEVNDPVLVWVAAVGVFFAANAGMVNVVYEVTLHIYFASCVREFS